MYKSFEIKNFRCFEHLKIDNLARVNLVAGKNNVGKTALLEALLTHCYACAPQVLLESRKRRGLDERADKKQSLSDSSPWLSLFRNEDGTASIEFSAMLSDGKRYVSEVSLVNKPNDFRDLVDDSTLTQQLTLTRAFERGTVVKIRSQADGSVAHCVGFFRSDGLHMSPLCYEPLFAVRTEFPGLEMDIQDVAQEFGTLEKTGLDKQLVPVLRFLEPRLVDLRTVQVFGKPVIHGNVGIGVLVSLPEMGRAMMKTLEMLLDLRGAQHGIVLIDEFENGLHHSILKDVWRAVAEAARKFDVQVFATTHSHECIEAAHEAFKESAEKTGAYDLRLHRLDRTKDGTIKVATFDQETLEAALDMDLEVR